MVNILVHFLREWALQHANRDILVRNVTHDVRLVRLVSIAAVGVGQCVLQRYAIILMDAYNVQQILSN